MSFNTIKKTLPTRCTQSSISRKVSFEWPLLIKSEPADISEGTAVVQNNWKYHHLMVFLSRFSEDAQAHYLWNCLWSNCSPLLQWEWFAELERRFPITFSDILLLFSPNLHLLSTNPTLSFLKTSWTILLPSWASVRSLHEGMRTRVPLRDSSPNDIKKKLLLWGMNPQWLQDSLSRKGHKDKCSWIMEA